MLRRSIFKVVLTGFWLLNSGNSLSAADVFWSNPLGGVFSDDANWLGGKAPTAADRTFFNSDSKSLVTFSADATTNGLWIRTDEVVFDLNAHTYTASGPSGAFAVGGISGDQADLTLRDGTQLLSKSATTTDTAA